MVHFKALFKHLSGQHEKYYRGNSSNDVGRLGEELKLDGPCCCLAGDAMNQFLRSNWEVVFKELKPVVDEAISTILTDAARKVFDRFSLAELFPVS